MPSSCILKIIGTLNNLIIITDLLWLAKPYQTLLEDQLTIVLIFKLQLKSSVSNSEKQNVLLLFSLTLQEAGNSVERAQQGMHRACVATFLYLQPPCKADKTLTNRKKNCICIAFLFVDCINFVINYFTCFPKELYSWMKWTRSVVSQVRITFEMLVVKEYSR